MKILTNLQCQPKKKISIGPSGFKYEENAILFFMKKNCITQEDSQMSQRDPSGPRPTSTHQPV
jgi:hypothetical protein